MSTLVGTPGNDVLTVTGGGSSTLNGMAGNDVLTGGNGDDFFDIDYGTVTGSAVGIDIMKGGDGNDQYHVDDIKDQVVEKAGGGSDMIFADVSYTLSSNVENLTLGASAANGTGNILDNTILGNNAANTLDGGRGNDVLDGGNGGGDTFIIDSLMDVIQNVSGSVTDISAIKSTVSVNINHDPLDLIDPNATLGNITNVFLTGNSAADIDGNVKDNTLIGNTAVNTIDAGIGDDTLDGAGGADILVGGLGDDVIFIDNVNDVVVELAGEGTDTIMSKITTDLNNPNYAEVENLVLIGTTNINGLANSGGSAVTGNSGRNIITGRAGDDILSGGLNSSPTIGDTLIGGDGNDTFVILNTKDVVRENLGEGTDEVIVFTDYDLSAGTNATQDIENMTLAGSAIIGTGNALANNIIGNNLDNTLDGKVGGDTMSGGAGNDVFIVDNGNDYVDEILNQGNDTVLSSVTFDMNVRATFAENLVLTGTAAIDGKGNLVDNTITGNSAANTLDGDVGADTMIGLGGDDVYIVDDVGDVVSELTGTGTDAGGTDTVQSVVSFTLGSFIENLELTGTLDVNGTGNASVNYILGNVGDNTLDGGGGDDTLEGGAGDDTYLIDVAGDTISESVGEGSDTVVSSVSYSLGGQDLENLTLTGTTNINGFGNTLDNTITGNDGNNVLDGGTGSDVLLGGLGNDSYFVDSIFDVVSEDVGSGTDTVRATLGAGQTFTLGAEVENLILLGAVASNGIGNDGANTLDGSQNAAVNTLTGGLGDDAYYVDAGDVVVENPGEGNDSIFSGFTYTINGEIENLTLTGTGNIDGTGSAIDNLITGNSGNNSLTGLGGNDTFVGGAGTDTMTGGIGNDTFDGGTGADTMDGGAGNDTYTVDNSGDVIIEGGGIDTIVSSATFNLSTNGTGIENLTLTGTAAINGTGDTGANVITGNTANNTLTGLGGDDTLIGGGGNDRLVGGTGNDSYTIDSTTDAIVELGGEGTDLVFSSANYILSAEIESLTLTGTANINATGNILNNVLTGNTGDNTLDGGVGTDAMTGGTGNDTYVVDNLGDTVNELAGEGNDTIRASITTTIATLANVENVALTGTADINATGNAGANTLTGNAGINTMTGGAGNDTYIVNSNDEIVELIGGGTDTAIVTITSGTYILDANIENVRLIGGTGSVNLAGDGGSNTLSGNDGRNTLDGGGGIDLLAGGKGADTYIVDDSGDVVSENAGEGTDLVQATASYMLSTNVENLTLLGTDDINGTGNGLDNTLTGNSGNNILDGGSGTDKLVGGQGDDTYIVDTLRDMIVDSSGTDTVSTALSYTLKAGLENLVLTGAGDVDGTGNNSDNTLTGNIGDNSLNGGNGSDTLFGNDGDDVLSGGAGSDVMNGGDGNDTYFVDHQNDFIVDGAGLGSDTLNVSVNYTLSATAEVETVTLTGTTALHFTGSDTDNDITGNSGANSIDGAGGDDVILGGLGNDILEGGSGADSLVGGAGVDRMTGGTGSDTFIFDAATAILNVDTITDFDISTDQDKIDISDLLTAFDPLTETLSDWVQIREGAANSTLWVNTTGDGVTSHYTQIANLQGITGITGEQALVDNGNLIIT